MTVPYVGVVGASASDEGTSSRAERVGRLLAEAGAVLVCGGLGGVMEAACKGATSADGLTVGLLPTEEREAANPYVKVAIPTGLGEMRNALLVRSVDAVIAIGGEFGTLSEIAFALKIGRPVVGLGSWEVLPGSHSVKRAPNPTPGELLPIHPAATPEEAVQLALSLARGR